MHAEMSATDVVTMEKIVSLCKRRGFVFPSSEIYGGLGSSYDYGHYGVLLKNNVRNEWWRAMLQERDDIVALDSAIIQHPTDVAGERPPGRLHRPARRLPHLQAPLPRRPHRAVRMRAQAVEASGRDAGLRSDRGPRLQPDVRDHGRPGQGGGEHRLPAPGDGAGDLPELPQLPAVLAQEAAVRDRPDRQELPQRDHHRQLHLPDARVRADGDGVLRPARRAPRWHEHWLEQRMEWWTAARAPPRPPAAAPARRRRALALLERHQRRRVPVPDRLVRARGDRQPRRLRPHRPRPGLGPEARVRRRRRAASATSRT